MNEKAPIEKKKGSRVWWGPELEKQLDAFLPYNKE